MVWPKVKISLYYLWITLIFMISLLKEFIMLLMSNDCYFS